LRDIDDENANANSNPPQPYLMPALGVGILSTFW